MPYDNTDFAQSIIVELDLDKIALCNQGANSRAHILLTKRKENSNMPKTFEELLAALTPEQAEIVKNHIAAIERDSAEAAEKAAKTITAKTAAIAKLEEDVKSMKKAEETPEELLKSVSPEIAAYVDDLKKSVNALVADKEEALAKSRFELVKALPVEEEELKTVLKSVSPAVFNILEKAAKAVEEKVLSSTGRELPNDDFSADTDSAYKKLEKSARAIMAEETTKTFEQAFVDACSKDPKTYAAYAKGAK